MRALILPKRRAANFGRNRRRIPCFDQVRRRERIFISALAPVRRSGRALISGARRRIKSVITSRSHAIRIRAVYSTRRGIAHVSRGSTKVHAVGTLFFAHSTNWSMMVGQAAAMCQPSDASGKAHGTITLVVMFIKVPVK